MQRRGRKDISIVVTFFYLKCVGFWPTSNRREEYVRRIVLICATCNVALGMIIESTDMYFSWKSYDERIYLTCNLCTLIMVIVKLSVSIVHRKEISHLAVYAKENFWYRSYDSSEQAIFDICKRTCSYLICIFSFFAQGTAAGYIIRPIVANIGQNETDRILPLKIWLDLPVSVTPYFEIIFVIQVITVFHVGMCYICFDNFLCIVNLHAACQFRMLQHRLSNVYPVDRKDEQHRTDENYATFKRYIKQHQALIAFCTKLEKIFSIMVLAQVLLFSLLICLDGYLVLMEGSSGPVRVTFAFHLTGCICQLLMFTYSCDCLIQDSTNVANAVYNGPWTNLPMDNSGRSIRRDLLIVSMRARAPCCLTACGFFIVSLETYTRVLSTAVSYFTLLNSC